MIKLPTLIPEEERYPASCPFRDIYKAYQHGRVLTPSTELRYKSVDEFIEWLGDRNITPSVIDEWHAYRKALNKSDYFIIKRAQSIYKWGIRNGYLLNDPFVGRLTPRAFKHKWKPVNHDTWLRIATALRGFRHYIPWVMCYETAMAYVDVCQLRWDMVDMTTGVITGKRVKMKSREGGNFETQVDPNGLSWPLLVHTMEILERKGDRATEADKTYVFPKLVKCNLAANLKAVLSGAGFKESERATFHDLRRTRITAMVNAGIPYNIVMRVSGHSSHSQLLEYVGVDSSAVQNAVVSSVQFSRVCKNQHSPSQLSSVPTDLQTSFDSASVGLARSLDPTRKFSYPTITPSTPERLRQSLMERAARLSQAGADARTVQETGRLSSTEHIGPEEARRMLYSKSRRGSSLSSPDSKPPF